MSTGPETLYRGASHAAWGYFFLYLDINLGSLNILPDWAAYALFLSAIGKLQGERRDLALLRPLGLLLAVWNGADWALALFGGGVSGHFPPLDLVVGVIQMYFHFQLLTNVADIARIDPQRSRSVLRLRNFRTVFVTLLALPWQPEAMSWPARDVYLLVTRFAAVILIIWTFSALFDVKNHVILGADGEESLPEREP